MNTITTEWKLHSQCKTDFNKSNKYVNSLAENAFVCDWVEIFHFIFLVHSSTQWKYRDDFDANGVQEFCKRASKRDGYDWSERWRDKKRFIHSYVYDMCICVYVYQLLYIENDLKSTYSSNTNTQFHKNNNIEENSFNARDTLLNGSSFFCFRLKNSFFIHSNAGLDGWLVLISVFFFARSEKKAIHFSSLF